MSEMVHRVARAILAKCEEFEARKGDIVEFDSRELAIAAIEAMREPTGAMLMAGHGANLCENAPEVWRAMIDEALK